MKTRTFLLCLALLAISFAAYTNIGIKPDYCVISMFGWNFGINVTVNIVPRLIAFLLAVSLFIYSLKQDKKEDSLA